MSNQKPSSSAEGERVDPSETKEGLDRLKEGVEKKSTLEMLRDFFRDRKKLSPEEQKKRIGMILASLTFGLFLKKKNEEKKPEEEIAKEEEKKDEEAEDKEQESPVEKEEKPEEEKEDINSARQVVCSNMRLLLVNMDPARKKFPHLNKVCKPGDSEFLNKYGLPSYSIWKREMISLLAPDSTSEAEGVKQVTDILQWCPMGKYQCMPKYLFGHIKMPFEGEEGLKAMWEFLQTEDLQRKACQGYLQRSARQYGNDPELVAASFYGGPRAANRLKRIKDGTATEADKQYVERKQGSYSSIADYSKGSRSKHFDLATLLAQTAGRESGSWKGKKTLERDEKWEQERYRKYWQGSFQAGTDETMIA